MGATSVDLERLRESLINARDAGPGVAARITTETTLTIFAESQQIVPVATGALRSRATAVIESEGDSYVGTITYGNNTDIDYAIYVHEIPRVEYVSTYSGKKLPGHKHALPRTYKFLEIPFDDDVRTKFDDRALKIVSDALDEAFK